MPEFKNPSSNADYIALGVPEWGFLPDNKYWKTKTKFTSITTIANFDPVTTNKNGSIINLLVGSSNKGLLGFNAGITFGKSSVRLSNANDQITAFATQKSIQLAKVGFELYGEKDTWSSPTPASLLMGDGVNTVSIGGGSRNWDIGLRVGHKASLIGGSGVDKIIGIGNQNGISIDGTIDLGNGIDRVEATAINGETGLYVSNNGFLGMGDGDDVIIGKAKASINRRSIYINGVIDMGAGNDSIIGDSLHVNSSTSAKILMGAGNDAITAPLESSNGAFFDFGSGIDKLALLPGRYSVAKDLGSQLTLSSISQVGSIWSVIDKISINGLEFLVSSVSGKQYAFVPGEIQIV